MSKVIKFRRRIGVRAAALVRRLLLVVVLLTGLDVVHDGRVGWPAMLAPGLASLTENAASVTDALIADEPAVEADLSGRVTRVIDGDSLEVHVFGVGPVEVRLHGIDTPEWDQPYGRAARAELRQLIETRRVRLASETIEAYGRLVATVYRDDLNVNHEMVRRGYAWWYRRYAGFDLALRRAEKEAREARRGLWRDEDPVPPWEWRRK